MWNEGMRKTECKTEAQKIKRRGRRKARKKKQEGGCCRQETREKQVTVGRQEAGGERLEIGVQNATVCVGRRTACIVFSHRDHTNASTHGFSPSGEISIFVNV
jgi:hypothetical protein